MIKDHVVIRDAHRFSPAEFSIDAGWQYRRDIGAWVDALVPDSLMVLASAARPDGGPVAAKKPRPVSKKADQETGEDMKGA